MSLRTLTGKRCKKTAQVEEAQSIKREKKTKMSCDPKRGGDPSGLHSGKKGKVAGGGLISR